MYRREPVLPLPNPRRRPGARLSNNQETTDLNRTKSVLLCVAICAAFAPAAHAQMTWTDQGFVNVSIGVQGGSRTLQANTTFPLYDEEAVVQTSQEVGGGFLFEVSGGWKVWRNLAIGLGFTRTSSQADATVSGQIPDPVFFDQPRPVTASASDLGHSETAVNISAVWMIPVTDKVDVALVGGPTIFSVNQDIPGSLTISEPGPTVSQVTVNSPSESAVGIHLGVDVTYMVTPRFGVGGLARFTRGSVDLEGASDSLTVGGFQIGAGLRVRF